MGNSENLSDWLSTPIASSDVNPGHAHQAPLYVVGWLNRFQFKSAQRDFAFRFCYHLIKLFILRRQQPEVAYGSSINFFERKMDLQVHTYTFGISADGEPCCSPPSRFSRRYVEWDQEVYHYKLLNAADRCADACGAFLDTLAGEKVKVPAWPNDLRDQDINLEVLYRIGCYFGWWTLTCSAKIIMP
jgi:hypothetical protein